MRSREMLLILSIMSGKNGTGLRELIVGLGAL